MKKIKKIAVLGGDPRQAALAAMLADNGYETATWAVNGNIGGAVRCAEWRSALASADAIILPIVAEDGGGRLNVSSSSEADAPYLRDILDASSGVVLGGKLSNAFVDRAKGQNREVIDYFLSEELQILNALPTAEGAVAIALENLDRTIFSSKILVVGYGRIGKALASLLWRMGARVDVAARKESDLARIEISGLSPKRIIGNSLTALVGGGYDVVFNTVPCMLFDSRVLEAACAETLYVDLASSPGGFDFSYAETCGIRVLRALSLPGKYFPKTAGMIIGKTILNYLSNF
jgi:dipicolinate synthase subunit A